MMTRNAVLPLLACLFAVLLHTPLTQAQVGSSYDSGYDEVAPALPYDLDDTDTLAKVDFPTVHKAGEIVLDAGNPEYKCELISAWILASDQYQKLSSDDLLIAARAISQAKEFGPKARAALADWLEKTYFSDDAKMRALGVSAWKDYSRYLLHDLGAARQKKWADKIASVFAASPEAIKALSAQDIADLVYTDTRLVGGRSGAMLKTWLSGDKRRANWDPGALVKGLGALSKTGADGAAARGIYGNLIGDQYLAADAADKLTPEQWKRVAQVCGAGMSADYQAQIKDKVRGAYATPEAIAKMDQKQVADVAAALKAVGDTDAGGIQAVWALDTVAGQNLSPKALEDLARQIGTNGVNSDLGGRILARLQATFLASTR